MCNFLSALDTGNHKGNGRHTLERDKMTGALFHSRALLKDRGSLVLSKCVLSHNKS